MRIRTPPEIGAKFWGRKILGVFGLEDNAPVLAENYLTGQIEMWKRCEAAKDCWRDVEDPFRIRDLIKITLHGHPHTWWVLIIKTDCGKYDQSKVWRGDAPIGDYSYVPVTEAAFKKGQWNVTGGQTPYSKDIINALRSCNRECFDVWAARTLEMKCYLTFDDMPNLKGIWPSDVHLPII